MYSLYEKNFLSPYTLSLLRGYKEQKAKTTLKDVEEENKMEKLMNKMDNMEMDKVSGGKIFPEL